jgi:dipeptidyl aminopeptidase/acylaminoacyl peptidase
VANAPVVLVSPEHTKLLLMERAPAGAAGVSAGLLLAGARIDPVTNSRVPDQTYSALIVQSIGKGDPRRMILPWKARVSHAVWSPDGHRVAFTLLEPTGTSLWVGDAYSGVIQMLAGPVLNGTMDEPCQWFPSADRLLCARIPDGRRPAPGAQAGFEHYLTSQPTVYLLSGGERPVGLPGAHRRMSIAPGGTHILVETMHPPWSDRLPLDRLPVRTEVWDATSGAMLRLVHDRGAVESAPTSEDAAIPGPRSIEWRGDRPATVVWAEAQDSGSPAVSAPVRDRLFQLETPFTSAPVAFADLEFRSRGVEWGSEGLAIVREGWTSARRSQSWVVIPERGTRRRLGAPGQDLGTILTRTAAGGGGRTAYLSGLSERATFFDRIDLVTGQTRRLWQARHTDREEIVGVIDAEAGRFITRREEAGVPNYFLRDLRKAGVVRLTSF